MWNHDTFVDVVYGEHDVYGGILPGYRSGDAVRRECHLRRRLTVVGLPGHRSGAL